ncbi:MAG: Rieske 2Fe-2S domain-containing protein [Planctomycetes bacterium]|nr:Rieske 2Fe-2S domain-containing protein [Planctomycetota bacterium]
MRTPPDSFDTQLSVQELDPARPRLLETPWGPMALFIDAGEVLCVQAFCPHLEGPLFQGSVAGGAVSCPWHYWRFDLRSGRRIGLVGAVLPGSDTLRRCRVSFDPRGAIVLHAPSLS